jgi:hypothetical protein
LLVEIAHSSIQRIVTVHQLSVIQLQSIAEFNFDRTNSIDQN